MRLLKILFPVFLFLVACEERVDIPLFPEQQNLLVVEGMLTNEQKNHRVRLSLPYLQQNGNGRPVTGAVVRVFEDTTAYVLTEFPLGSGNYYTPLMRGLFAKRYTLVIQYYGKIYYAQDSPPPVQPLEPLDYGQSAKGYILRPAPQGEDPNYVEHLISWEHTADCGGQMPCDGRVIFYDLKTVDVNEIYKPDKEPFYFPRQSIVIRKKYSVSAGYKSFLRSMLSETQWRGGVFDVQRADVSTNLSEGAVGFFAVCSVVSDTTLVE